jgi:pyridoxal phosphate enzyme (YggS family)
VGRIAARKAGDPLAQASACGCWQAHHRLCRDELPQAEACATAMDRASTPNARLISKSPDRSTPPQRTNSLARAKIRAMASTSSELSDNLARVRERIGQAAARAGRAGADITLIAVSKTHSARKILELYEAGLRHFGENRVQEREAKLAHVSSLRATWHMIGHLQKNKAARAAQLFDSIDSVDSVMLAEKLDRARTEGAETTQPGGESAGRKLRVLIEIRMDPEPAKSGATAGELPKLLEVVMRLPRLELRGIMGVPPYFDNPEDARPFFRHLRELRDAMRAQSGPEILPVLSMGMSHDFEIAIEEGATEVRVGTALFGERERP